MTNDTQTAPRHLLTVWNPSYADDAMDEHLRVLLDWARRHRAGDAEADEVHVCWAKLGSPNRVEPPRRVPPRAGDPIRHLSTGG